MNESAVKMLSYNDRSLGKAISRAEHAHESGQNLEEPLWTKLPESTQIIGITGPPGVGKSTLTDKLIACARLANLKVGVLAIDPSSPFSGGAILGDRVRMSQHAGDPGVFIRSMGSRSSTGGLAAAARSGVRILASHGADIVILETVGVGQAELGIMHVADTVIVVVVPGLGDTVQMNKAGILEIGDVFVVNQSDRAEAPRTKNELQQALMIGHHSGEMPTIAMTQAMNGDGVPELWGAVRAHFESLIRNNRLTDRRAKGQKQEIYDEVRKNLLRHLDAWLIHKDVRQFLDNELGGNRSVGDVTACVAAAFLNGVTDLSLPSPALHNELTPRTSGSVTS